MLIVLFVNICFNLYKNVQKKYENGVFTMLVKNRYTSFMPKQGKNITIHHEWCKQCDICLHYCPVKVFEKDETGKIIVAHPERCTGCLQCPKRCPDMAIFVDGVGDY